MFHLRLSKFRGLSDSVGNNAYVDACIRITAMLQVYEKGIHAKSMIFATFVALYKEKEKL